MIERGRFVRRALIAFAHDVTMAGASFAVALLLRLGPEGFLRQVSFDLVVAWVLFVAVCAIVFYLNGLYRGVWRYASMDDLVAIVRAVSLALLVYLPVTFLTTRLDQVPRASLIINWFVLIFMLGTPRMLYRLLRDHGTSHLLERTSKGTPALLIGAGDAAEAFLREMGRDPRAPYEIVGLIDRKRGGRAGRFIRGVPVRGALQELGEILTAMKDDVRPPERLIVCEELDGKTMRELMELAQHHGIEVARLPHVAELGPGTRDERFATRPIAIEDLLGRAETRFDPAALRELVAGRRILVTGAGGSIGSELVRQIAEYAPAQILLVDSSESSLYAIDQELHDRLITPRWTAAIADVCDAPAMARLFDAHRPELVFHAAALKHVPLVEQNPLTGMQTNVIGTRVVAEACLAHDAMAMVLISTDKAVNPASVMGATKRLAENYCQALDLDGRERGGTRFLTVRFGNVLGSTGSVVPLFQRQLEAGGPLTVTHPDMTRYFMTTHEAVQLVLQASAMGLLDDGDMAGKIFVLDMGEPVRIFDLAQEMIHLAGYEPGRDVEIVYSGLRPGEKLHEELFHEGEDPIPAGRPGLLLAAPRPTNSTLLTHGIEELDAALKKADVDKAINVLKRLVPEYGDEPRREDAGERVVSLDPR